RRSGVVLSPGLAWGGIAKVVGPGNEPDDEVVVALDEVGDVGVGGGGRVGEVHPVGRLDAGDRHRALVELVRLVQLLRRPQPLLGPGSAAEGDHDLEQQVAGSLLDPAAAIARNEPVALQGGLCPRRIGGSEKVHVLLEAERTLEGEALGGVLLVVGGRWCGQEGGQAWRRRGCREGDRRKERQRGHGRRHEQTSQPRLRRLAATPAAAAGAGRRGGLYASSAHPTRVLHRWLSALPEASLWLRRASHARPTRPCLPSN